MADAISMHPLLWWGMVSSVPHLKEIAIRIFRMPASATGGILMNSQFIDLL